MNHSRVHRHQGTTLIYCKADILNIHLIPYVLPFGLAAAASINPIDEDDRHCLSFKLEHLSYKTPGHI